MSLYFSLSLLHVTALQQLNALEDPSSSNTSPSTVRYAPAFGEFIAASEQYQSLPPNLSRYKHWLNQTTGSFDGSQSQLPKDTNQPIRRRLASESAADLQASFLRGNGRVDQQNSMDQRQRPRSLVLASYCDDGIESLPPQEIPVSPRFTPIRDTVDMLRKKGNFKEKNTYGMYPSRQYN